MSKIRNLMKRVSLLKFGSFVVPLANTTSTLFRGNQFLIRNAGKHGFI